MKLKAIKYALMYGKSRESLVRPEGARRIRQAELLGSGIYALPLKNQMAIISSNTALNIPKAREQGRCLSFSVRFGG